MLKGITYIVRPEGGRGEGGREGRVKEEECTCLWNMTGS